MAYTEIRERNKMKYYYRVKSIKIKGKVKKKRIYLGANLNYKKLRRLEIEADEILNKSLNKLLTVEERKKLDSVKKSFKNLPGINFRNRYEVFISKFTYDSTAIEGNTINLRETSFLLIENRTPSGKSLREINETLNHKRAFDFLLDYDSEIDKKFICELQNKVVENLLNEKGYRKVQVYIRGVDFVPTHFKNVGMEMRSLIRWYNFNKGKVHPLILAAYFHVAFESIHPFVDGNGRVGRLLLNLILHKNGFPMINIPNTKRLGYYKCLEEAQQKNNLRIFVKFLYELMAKNEIYV